MSLYKISVFDSAVFSVSDTSVIIQTMIVSGISFSDPIVSAKARNDFSVSGRSSNDPDVIGNSKAKLF